MMKKIIIILITCILVSGCYDYREVNDLAIISGIGVDYKDDEYKVTLEILNTVKNEANSTVVQKTTMVEASDENFAQAMNYAIKKIEKNAYFSHLQILLLSKEVAEHGISDIADYLFRSIHVTESFYTVIVQNAKPYDVFDAKIANNEVSSDEILNMIESTSQIASINVFKQFDFLVGTMEAKGKDIVIPTIKFNDDTLDMGNIAIFNYDKLAYILNDDENKAYYLLTEDVNSAIYTNEDNVISVYDNNYSIKLKNNKFNIDVKLYADIQYLKSDFNLKDPESLSKLKNLFQDQIEKSINDLISVSKRYKSDFLHLGNKYYKKYPNDYYPGIGLDLEYKLNVELAINKNGYTYEVIK